MNLATCTRADFEPLLQSTFELRLEGLAPVSVVLFRVTEGRPVAGFRTPFSLHFRLPLTLPLEQGTYVLQHAALGEVALLLVPVGKNAEGLIYEAAFG